MLSSSSEYIQALRAGNYLLFLGWADFIAYKYQDRQPLDADDAANFFVFEWLNNEYSEEDAKKLALLYAVCNLDSNPIKGKLDYSLNTILIALFLCMTFKKYALEINFDAKKKMTSSEIIQLIKQIESLLNPDVYRNCLEKMRSDFFGWVEGVDKNDVTAVFQKINVITKPRYLLEDYVSYLEGVKPNNDALYESRLSLAKRLLSYLYEQNEMSATVSEEISRNINLIRIRHPNKVEEALLDIISPPSVLETTTRMVRGLGIGFFSLVLNEKSIGELISGTSESLKN